MKNLKNAIGLSVVLFLGFSNNMKAQCNTGVLYGTSTPVCNGTQQVYSVCTYAGEYNILTLTAGTAYTFGSSIATDFLTVTDATNTVVAFGTQPLLYTPAIGADYRIYVHTNAACGTESVCRDATVQCGTPPPPVANDDCASAITITPGTYTGTTVGATADVAPLCVTTDGTGGGVWYAISGTSSCSAFTVSLCNATTTYDSKIRVYEGSCASPICVTGIDDFCGVQSEVTWNYTPGTTYYVLIHGYGSDQGAFEMTVSEAVVDVDAPVADIATLTDVTAVCEVTSLTAPTATDACIGAVTGTHNAIFPITASTAVTWTYTDGTNTSTQTQNVVISDNSAPVADVATLTDVTSTCAISSLTAPTATDNCAGTVTGTHNTTFPISASTVVTWTYTDGTNTSTQTQNVVINDNSAPVADLVTLADVTSACEVTSLTAPTATDNCAGTVTGTHNATFPITVSTLVTWTYTDGSNTSTQTQNVVINDNSAPVADVATLAEVTSTCEVTSLVAPTATDNCVGTVTGIHAETFPITASTVVTWTYTDGTNTATQTQNIVINDNVAPVADVVSLADVVATCEVTSLTAPTASDNCVGTVSGTHNATFPITTSSSVTWTYTDGTNTTTQTQNILINDIDVTVNASVVTLTANNTTAGVTYQWIDCGNMNAEINGETSVAYTATSNGSYSVIVTQGNCTDTSDCFAITQVGIEEFGTDFIALFPNPAMNEVNIQTPNAGTIALLDVNGRIVLETKVNAGDSAISLVNIATGNYTVRLTTESSVNTQRLVVQKK